MAESSDRPNIVLIMADDMGWADPGCFGGEHISTPNIDRLAAEGLRFTDAYSGCTVCAPARSVLMTGLHNGHGPVRGNTGGIPLADDDVTLAEVLKQSGYATGAFGKWGLGEVGTPGVAEKQGFDVFFGYYHQIHAHSYFTPYLWRNSQRVPLPGNADGRQEQYSHLVIVEEMLKFIREHKDEPFFCYGPWTPPHAKYELPPGEPAWELYKDKPWPHEAKVAAAMDTMVDRNVGQVLDLLKELGLDRRTLVIFCSDNGAAQRFDGSLNSCGPLRGQKRDLYEGGLRTPMVARWPGRIDQSTTDHICYFGDILPTFAELAGAESYVPRPIDGVSMVPTLLGADAAGRAQQQHDYLYWEYGAYRTLTDEGETTDLAQAVRQGKWKLLRPNPNRPWELYDLSADIGEANNLAEQMPEKVARLSALADEAHTTPRPQTEPTKPEGKQHQ